MYKEGLSSVGKFPQAHEKVCNENARKKKQHVLKMFLMEERIYKAHTEKLCDQFSDQRFFNNEGTIFV